MIIGIKVSAVFWLTFEVVFANRQADQLYGDLLWTYNKVVRPVKNASDVLTVKFGSSLIRIIDVDSKNQVFTTNLWLEVWTDSKLVWEPDEYGGIRKLHMPADQIWLPDIVLYNNAAGDPEISIYTDALVYFDGTVIWKPPSIYKSFCAINVLWFPYDAQSCWMKFGLWTHTGEFADFIQLPEDHVKSIPDPDWFPLNPANPDETAPIIQNLDIGMDLSYFYENAEWDLMQLTCRRHEVVYSSCCGPEKYVDITFYFELRRKTLFYTVNLIIPCALISFLTTFVFYLPATPGGHQLTFSISILVTLTFFLLIQIELIPPTSVVVPLFAKFLLFTMTLVTLSIVISVVCVNFHHRRGTTHVMAPWVRVLFLEKLPRLLLMKRPKQQQTEQEQKQSINNSKRVSKELEEDMTLVRRFEEELTQSNTPECLDKLCKQAVGFIDAGEYFTDEQLVRTRKAHALFIIRILKNVQFISKHFKEMEELDSISNDWIYVTMVIDRLFFIIFTIVNILGTIVIIFQAPTFYDTMQPLKIPVPTKPLGGDTLGPAYANY